MDFLILIQESIDYISLKNNDENSQYVLQHILPQLSHPEYISSLRLENIKQISLFSHKR
jgi:hypothetical protein